MESTCRLYDINSLTITISFLYCTISVKYAMVTGEIRVAMTVSTGIRVTKAITNCVLSNGNCWTQHTLGTNNNDYDYNERERQVIELYDHGKSTRHCKDAQNVS